MTDPRETYVLDTCVLLADPHALHRFDEHDVVLPLVVIEELDRKKTAMDDVGRNARHALRLIEDLRVEHGGGLAEQVPLSGGGTFRIESNHVDVPLPPYLDPHKADHRILAVAIGLRGTLVTKDAALRIKGAQLGVATEDYRGDTHPVSEHYEGVRDLDVEPHVVDELHRDGKVRVDAAVAELAGEPLFVNECLVMKAGRSASALGRVIDGRRVRRGHRAQGPRPPQRLRDVAPRRPPDLRHRPAARPPRAVRVADGLRRAPARPSSPWPPGSSRCSRRPPTAACRSTAR